MDFPFAREAISKLFSKSSCNMYPAVPSEAAQNYRGRIAYRADKCIGCGMCERVCAGGAITRTIEKGADGQGDKVTLTFDLGSCTFCATCADFCSRHAITLIRPQPLPLVLHAAGCHSIRSSCKSTLPHLLPLYMLLNIRPVCH